MNTATKIKFLQAAQDVADLNKKLLEAINEIPESEEETAAELVQASQKLIQAQNNIIKAVNK
jgi:hypothetical protein